MLVLEQYYKRRGPQVLFFPYTITFSYLGYFTLEIEYKTKMWLKVNADYLTEKAEKEERERKEAEEAEKEGKDIKKKIGTGQNRKPRYCII